MPRPFCCRQIAAMPRATLFAPQETLTVPLDDRRPFVLQLDELEALRLADLERMYHQQAAEEMNVSRQTFGRILDSARAKVADAIVNARPLRVQGGEIEMTRDRTFVCDTCGHTWKMPCGTGRPAACDACGGAAFHRVDAGAHGHACGCGGHGGHARHGQRHQHRHGQDCRCDGAAASPASEPAGS